MQEGNEGIEDKAVNTSLMNQLEEVGLEVFNFLRRMDDAALASPLFHLVQQVMQNHRRPSRCTTIFIDDSQSLSLHGPALFIIIKQFKDRRCQTGTVADGNAGIAPGEQGMGLLEVEHVVTGDYSLTVSRRLKNIMTAMRNQAAAYIDYITYTVDLTKLADGIQDNYIVTGRRLFLQLGTAGTDETGLLCQLLHLPGSEKLTGGDDQRSLRLYLPKLEEGIYHHLILTLMGTAGQKDSVTVLESHLSDEALLYLCAYRSVGLVILRVARIDYKTGVGTKSDNVLTVDR